MIASLEVTDPENETTNPNRSMQTIRTTCRAFLLTVSAILIASPKTFAASGTWTQATSGGLWSDTTNWSGGIVADGSGSSGIFNTIDLVADNTVHMDAAHALTSLTFGDTDTSTAANWTLDNNGTAGNILTLAGTTPSITVGALGAGKAVEISAVLAGSTAWTKLGAGPLTLSGANTFTGNWAVNAGTLNYNGSLTGGTQLTVNGSGANSIVNIGSGASIAFNNANILDGNNATAGTAGAVFQSGGTVTGVNQLQLGAVTGGSYGYYNLTGSAALTIAELDCGGFNGAPTGVFDIAGGTLTDNNWLIIARGSGGSSLLNLTGGTVNFAGTTANRLLMNFNANASQSAVINVANANFNALNATAGVLNMMNNGSAGQLGAVNLLSGGVMQVQGVRAGNTTGTSHFNFNGGKLKASTANANFLDGSVSLANVYSGGTIDNNGVAITISKALTTPAGNGLNGSVTLNNGGSGYIGAPAVTFSGGGGSGATAYATVSGGAVTGVVITSPGVNYSSTPTLVFTGGGGTGASATAPAPTANTSGGMTFQGSGTTILNGANTYGGDTTISSGTAVLTTANTYGGNTLINGGTLKLGSALLHLSFDNVSGSTVVNDGSGGPALNGILNGTATIVSGGMFGNCLNISGANAAAASCRVASSVVPLNVGAGNSWTVAMWIKSSTAGGCYAYQGDGAWASGNSTFYMNQGNGTLNASSTKAGGVRNSQGWEKGTADINNGQWHHVVMTCNGTTKTQYVDGNVDSLTVNAWNGNGTGGQFWIGGSADTGDGTANLNGQIDEVYVFKRALSQAEVQSLYNNNNNSVSETILPPNTAVVVAAGATLDVSATSFSMAGNQSLMGSGTVAGAVTTVSTSKIYAGTDGAVGTLSFSNNLTMASGSTFNLDVSTSAASGNDSVVVSGALALNATTFNVKALSGASDLDATADYVLVTAGSISGDPNAAVSWVGTAPGNAANFTVVKNGNAVVLHYSAANPPIITSATASPTTLTHGQSALITAAVTPGDAALSSVTVSGTALTGTVTLVSDGAGHFTNTATISPGASLGSQTLAVQATDANLLVALSNITVTVSAQNEVWNGGGSDNKWTTGGNWTSGLQPGTGDRVSFDGSAQLINDLDASLGVASLTFNSGAGSFTVTNAANTLTLTGGLTNNSANIQTLDVPVALNGSQTINASSGGITISQAVSGSGNDLTKIGPGTLTLSGVNTYSGATIISNGLLTIGGAGQLGDGNYSGNITVHGSLNIGSSASQTWSGIISGTGSLTNSGAGTLTLNGANNYSGGTTISAGTIVSGNNSAFGTGTITANGGALRGSVTTTNNIVVNNATTFDVAGGNWNLSGNISGSGAINRGTSATLTLYLAGDNSGYAGTFTSPNNGNAVIRFTSASAGSAGASWVFNQPNAGRTTLEFIGAGTISFGSLTGSGPLQSGNNNGTKTISAGALGLNDIYSGVIANGSSTVALNKVGAGIMTLSGANTYTGNTTISNGVLALSGSGSIANSLNISVATNASFDVSAVTGGSYSLNGSGTLSLNVAKTGSTLTQGHVTATSLTAGGTLNITASGDALADGDTFTLFNVQPSGTFATTNLPAIPSGGTNWWTANNYRTLTYNVWPTATGATVTHPKGVSVKISVASLVSGATNGKALLVTGTPTVSGATFQRIGAFMLYTPGPGDANDSFTYTVNDGRGGSVSATLNVQIDSASAIGQTSPRLEVHGGQTSVKFYGVPGCAYVVERSLDLGSWTPISTNSVTTGNLEISIMDNPGADSAYYRLKLQN